MVSNGRTYPRYRRGGRFFGRRVNCEQVPLLPAGAVARMLDDPRKIPYLLVWRSRSDGKVQEAARIASYNETADFGGLDWTGAVEVKRHDGTRNFIRTVLHSQPGRGRSVRFLICPYCKVPRRALFGWEPGGRFTNSVTRSMWQCRACAMLRYASEGRALVSRGRSVIARLFEQRFGLLHSRRPEPWLPYIFSSPKDAAAAGLCMLK
jgi:hypothetical protein